MKLPAMKWALYWSLTERFGKIESAKMHNMYPRESNIRDYNLFANSLVGEPSKHLSPEFQAIENTSPTSCNYCPLYYIYSYYVRWCSGPTYYANQNKNHPDFKVRPSSLNKKRYPSLFVVCFSLTTRHDCRVVGLGRQFEAQTARVLDGSRWDAWKIERWRYCRVRSTIVKTQQQIYYCNYDHHIYIMKYIYIIYIYYSLCISYCIVLLLIIDDLLFLLL